LKREAPTPNHLQKSPLNVQTNINQGDNNPQNINKTAKIQHESNKNGVGRYWLTRAIHVLANEIHVSACGVQIR
jgi:hypothetical protein